MVGHDHVTHHVEQETLVDRTRNARLGRWLFFFYLALYVGYMYLVAFRADVMRQLPWGGVNVAVLYGFGLIAAALVVALVYGWLCRVREA